jgi:hypothetical protein
MVRDVCGACGKIGGYAMADILTLAEIKARFDSEWVLIDDPDTSDALDVKAGSVLFHSKDREEVYRKAIEFRPKRFAMIFTGRMPEGTAIVL